MSNETATCGGLNEMRCCAPLKSFGTAAAAAVTIFTDH